MAQRASLPNRSFGKAKLSSHGSQQCQSVTKDAYDKDGARSQLDALHNFLNELETEDAAVEQSDEEVEEIVNHLKSYGPPAYMSGVVEGPEDDAASDIDMVLGLGSGDSSDDALYDQAVAIVAKDRKCSTSYIQRKLGIGYNKAARLVEQMQSAWIAFIHGRSPGWAPSPAVHVFE